LSSNISDVDVKLPFVCNPLASTISVIMIGFVLLVINDVLVG